jgi:hypothetical protein
MLKGCSLTAKSSRAAHFRQPLGGMETLSNGRFLENFTEKCTAQENILSIKSVSKKQDNTFVGPPIQVAL